MGFDKEVVMIGGLISDAILTVNDEDELEQESDQEDDSKVEEEEEEEEATITSFEDLMDSENYIRVNEIVSSKVGNFHKSI